MPGPWERWTGSTAGETSGRGCSPSPEMSGWTHCRRHRRETELPGEELPGGGDFAGALEDREEVLALHRILHTLPEPYKEVFGLRVFGELPFRAIGQVFGKTEGWARVTYYRAKSRILRQWEAERDESEL